MKKTISESFSCFLPAGEMSDLFKFGSFKQGYQNCKNQIESQMKQYAVCQEALEQTVQSFEMNDKDDAWDLIALTTQHNEQQDSVQGFVEKEPEVVESYDFSEDLHIPSTHIENQALLNELPDEEYRQLVSSLNKEQKEFFFIIFCTLLRQLINRFIRF